jgi:hypothetical protein
MEMAATIACYLIYISRFRSTDEQMGRTIKYHNEERDG